MNNNINYSGIDELSNSKSLHNYHHHIIKLFLKYLPKNLTVIDFGAGMGTLSTLWESNTQKKPYCVEIDPTLCSILSEKGFEVFDSVNSAPAFEALYSADVLEHIKDDKAVLKNICQKISPYGTIAIYVPAFMCLYSDLDKSVGHYRRYHKNELIEKVKTAGFEVVDCFFVDVLGFFASYFVKYYGYNKTSGLGNTKSLVIYDRFIFPVSRLLDKCGFKYLFGKNLFLIAKKK